MSKLNVANIRKTLYYLKRNGLKNTWYAAKERLDAKAEASYTLKHVTETALKEQSEWSKDKDLLFSIVVPTYRTNEVYLIDMVNSVRAQSYPLWELVIADATEDDSVGEIVSSYGDERIRYIHLEENKGISENTNIGIEAAKGDYIGLLDHDDFLEPDLLYEAAHSIYQAQGMYNEINKDKNIEIKMLYTDEDKCDSNAEKFYEPNFKENFNLDLILSNNYICHFLLLKAGLMKRLKLRREYDGAQDYDLVLRAVSELKDNEEQILHIPKVLYHWRCHSESTAENPQSKLYAYEAGRRALQDFADRENYNAEAVSLKHLGFYALDYKGDIFDCRPDIGAVGGRIIKNDKIVGGRMNSSGKVYYEGLSQNYSGYMHRAVLTQSADAVDIRCIRVRPELRELFKKIQHVTYTEDESGIFDASTLPSGCDAKELSIKFSEAVRSRGYRILYKPVERKIPSYGKHKKTPVERTPETPITVVIPNFNGEKYLRSCLESLLAESSVVGTPCFRVLVVENGSVDKSNEILREFEPSVETIYLNENTGFCHAVNEGIKASDSKYVILLNNDTKVKTGFIKALYEAMEKRTKAFSVSSKMLMWDRPELVDDAGDYYCALGWAYGRGKGKPASDYDKAVRVFSACGGASIYRRKAFDEIGLFDERHFAYLEDLDIGYRARIYGYRNYYEPKAQVLHYGSASTGSRYNDKKTTLSSANNVYVILKNMPFLQLLLNMPLLIPGFLIKFIFFCRKKMGMLYLKGLCEGLRKGLDEAGRNNRITFKARNLPNYIVIQLELYLNIFRLMK